MLSEVVRLFWGAGSAAFGVFSDKAKSEEIYRYVVPELHNDLRQGKQWKALMWLKLLKY